MTGIYLAKTQQRIAEAVAPNEIEQAASLADPLAGQFPVGKWVNVLRLIDTDRMVVAGAMVAT